MFSRARNHIKAFNMKIWSKKLCSFDCQCMRNRSFFQKLPSPRKQFPRRQGGTLEVSSKYFDLDDRQQVLLLGAAKSDRMDSDGPFGSIRKIRIRCDVRQLHQGDTFGDCIPNLIWNACRQRSVSASSRTSCIFFLMSYGQNVWGPLYQRCTRNTAKRPPKAIIGKKTGKQHVPPKKLRCKEFWQEVQCMDL